MILTAHPFGHFFANPNSNPNPNFIQNKYFVAKELERIGWIKAGSADKIKPSECFFH